MMTYIRRIIKTENNPIINDEFSWLSSSVNTIKKMIDSSLNISKQNLFLIKQEEYIKRFFNLSPERSP